MSKLTSLTALCLIILLSACNKAKNTGPDALASHIDSTVVAGDDFFSFANGKWFKANPIPSSEKSNGIWQLIQDTVNAQILQICKNAASQQSNGDKLKEKIGDFYFSGMDSTSLNKKGISDIKNELASFDTISNIKGLLERAAYVHRAAASPLMGIWVAQDDKNSSKYALYLAQGGLSLPDRSYYTDTDAKSSEIRKKFEKYAETIFGILGNNPVLAKANAAKLLEMETKMAQSSRKREDLRDPFHNYNKMTIAQLSASTPAIDWKGFLTAMGVQKADSVIVGQPEYLTALNGYLKQYSINDWKNYLRFHFLNSLSDYMDDKTFMASFSFYETVLNGIETPQPRWKRVVNATNGNLGDLVGQVYVSDYLPKGTKEKLLEIGNAIKAVFAERIKALDWMSKPTKEKALKKLDAIVMKVGYPDKWKDQDKIQTDRHSYVRNSLNAAIWASEHMLSKLGKKVDRTEWSMEPQTYNAYYNPSNNEIVIPGCNILVPGYEGRMADDAILYAIIGGSTFGHEITHGFDDQGCKYDEKGNLKNWWTPQDSAKFYSKTRKIVEQFNQFTVVDNLHINGELTQGENIADLGGIVMGLEAFKKTEQYKKNEKIAGLTPLQRYFLGYALAWMVNMRPEALSTQVKSDEHSPAKWRVLGPLANMPEFYEAFGVKKENKMWRTENERIRIW